MSSATLVSITEYLSTSYRPDKDYVDGELQERNAGEWPHSRAQGRLYAFLFQREAQWGIRVVPEQRVQVSPTRFRIPDICAVLASEPIQPILTQPPFLCIEILSNNDTVSQLNDRLTDYFRMGVRYVWVIDPLMRRAYVYTHGHMREVLDGYLRTKIRTLLSHSKRS
jgi:Uma2 family endonuclease